MRVPGIVLGVVAVLFITGCGAAKPVLAEGRVKARLTQDPLFGEEDSRISVTVLSSTMKQVRESESGPSMPKITSLRRGDLPDGARKGAVVDCEVRFRQKFQSNDSGSAEAEDCRIIG
jgi:hypothetical protein